MKSLFLRFKLCLTLWELHDHRKWVRAISHEPAIASPHCLRLLRTHERHLQVACILLRKEIACQKSKTFWREQLG
jgi:hypothetical protein